MKKNRATLLFIFLIGFIFISAVSLLSSINIAEADNTVSENINSRIDRLLAAEYVEEELIVKFVDETVMDTGLLSNVPENIHSQIGVAVKKKFKELKGLHHVKVPINISLRQALEHYLSNPLVEYAEPNYVYHAYVLPNDPSFSQLWGLHNSGQTGGTVDADIDAPLAWDLSTGSASVVIAVVDTGVDYNHSDLNANIWRNAGETSCTDGIDNDGNGYVDDCRGWDFVNNDNNPLDDNEHGTHVSGTIAAEGNNGTGVAGVNWTAKIMPLKFLDSRGSGSTADAVEAILYANANGAHAINNSWGGGAYSQALKDAIDASPAVVVCAAGNDGTNNDTTAHYPSNYTSANLISVAATSDTDSLASFSNYGVTSVDLGAPGVSIYSTIPNGSYASFSGTSMASPHVAGVAGLVKALNPGFTNLQVRSRILNTTDPKSSLSGRVATGGRLNAFNALTGIVTAPDISTSPVSKNFGTVAVGTVSSVQIFTISNDGGANLVIAGVYLTGPNPFQFSMSGLNCEGKTLVPSGSCTIEAQYVPTKTGTMYAKIGIGSNDFDTPTLYIDLNATGVDNIPPVADPNGPYTATEGQAVTLDASGSTDSDGSIALYEWDINNDGTFDYSSTSPTQSHTYQTGIYTINLRVTDDLGATGEATTTATISDSSPTADFTGLPISGLPPLTVNFTDNSTGYDQPLSYEWDFNNNGTIDSTVQNPSYTFNTAGTYTVSLTVTDSDGSANSLTRTDYITVGTCLPPAWIMGTTVYYSTLQAAYDASVEGDTIQSQSVVFIEDLNTNLNKSVTMQGGYDCDYAVITGVTTVNGTMTVSDGTVTVENFRVE